MKYEKLNKRAMGFIILSDLIKIVIRYIILIPTLYVPFKFLPDIISIGLKFLILKDVLHLMICPKIKYEIYRYSITEDSIEIKEGFLFVEINIVPIKRIHKVIIKKTPIHKLFNLSNVVLTTAGGDVIIKLLDDKKTKAISSMLNHKINEIAKEEKLNEKS